MSWQDRIQQASYTPSAGERIEFAYEDVARTVSLRGTAFEFPDANGTLIQRTGQSGRQYPVRAIFHGADCDLLADAYEAAISLPGRGVLTHPIYGTITVAPMGDVTREDRLKTAANQVTVEVTFWETIGTSYPLPQNDPASEVSAAVDAYNTASAEGLENNLSLTDGSATASFKNQYDLLLDDAAQALRPIAALTSAVSDQFELVYTSVSQGIDVLVADPLSLAFQTSILVEAPARAADTISARLSAYANLAAQILGQSPEDANALYTADLFASGYVAGSVTAVLNNQFETRAGALLAAEEVIAQHDALTEWRDANYQALGLTDTGEQYQQLQNAVAVAAGFLVEISFSLKQERRIYLPRNRTMVDLCAELYGTVDDDVLNFFIDSNALAWAETLEIPAGREILYYV